MQRRPILTRTLAVLTVLAVLATAGWLWYDRTIAGNASANATALPTPASAPPVAPAQDSAPATASRIIVQAPVEVVTRPSSGAGAAATEPAPLASPPPRETLAPEQARIAEMMSRRNLARLIAETAAADDVHLNAYALLLVDFCMSYTSARAKAQAAVGGPAPAALRAKPAAGGSEGVRVDATDSRRLDNARLITESCKDFNEGSAQSYADAALTRLNAKGSNAGMVFADLNPQLDYKALSPRQYSVIVDAMNEKNLGLLEVLGSQISPALAGAFPGGGASEAAAGALAWQLALCQLGAYCGRDSLALRNACWRYGACAGDDLGSAVRAAIVRDGLPGTALDKQVALYVKAITTHDPELLGIRRK